ncbi:MAG: hypothetical protein AAF328_04525 [Planctomycetota bacterium]
MPALAGYNTFDFFIDIVGEYGGSQMLAVLDEGEFFQSPIGTDSPPNLAFFSVFPKLEFDTFLAQGGATSQTTVGTLNVGGGGGPFGIDGSLTDLVTSNTRIQAQYNPNGSDFIADQNDFLIARLSISNGQGDLPAAQGVLQYLGSANENISPIFRIAFGNGTFLPLPGDFDGNGQVGQGDLNLVLNNWGEPSYNDGPESFTGWVADYPDNLVSQNELNRVLNGWGDTAPPDFRGATVPEPAALLGLIGSLVLARQRR